ncbi:hypothetical protein CCR75_003717 [Bremia lactucae]|uniref:Acyltransferase 3 domain-containing protein n=1 Tax=Bremia lactucae TaxID=4779 RepID=A0A976IKG4_BRELC|nr:hypothetical protein CCR75_003717 [Bremia lactucae]
MLQSVESRCFSSEECHEVIELDVISLSDPQQPSLASNSSTVEILESMDSIVISPIATKKAISSKPTKILFLDGARGLAAMLVVIQHSQEFVPTLHLGSVGVDIFFVLSSFLLTMICMKLCLKLLSQGARHQTWAYTFADYFQKRFLRVYPLFFVTVIGLSLLNLNDQKRYFVKGGPPFDTVKTLTFSFKYRYHVFWSLPLEIAYYFVIPVFVLAVISMRCFWWIATLLLSVWIVNEGVFGDRQSHMPLRPHISTFLTGSVAAVVFVKMDTWIKKTEFVFRYWHIIPIRMIEGVAITMLFSVCFRGLLFHWVHANPAPPPSGFPYISAFLAIIIVIEMLLPSCVSTLLEWNFLRYCGKISFSIYLLHSFVLYNPALRTQTNYFDRLFSRLFIILAVCTATYYLVEYPSMLLAKRVSAFLANAEKKATDGWSNLIIKENVVMHKRSCQRDDQMARKVKELPSNTLS